MYGDRPLSPAAPNQVSQAGPPLLSVTGLVKEYGQRRPLFRQPQEPIRAVDGVSFEVYPQETLGLVGESGCGKSTLARSLLRLVEPTSGVAMFAGQDVFALSKKELRAVRKDIQIVFQDPYASLDPRMTVSQLIEEPWIIFPEIAPTDRNASVVSLLERVGLSSRDMDRYPHEFSGGQRQRIGIARALALEPKLLVCDEPVSALDVSVQAQVINLLKEIQRDLGLSYIFISHDLSVVRHISDRVAVMYLGKFVEVGEVGEIFERPAHPYTRALLSAVPVPDPLKRGRRTRFILSGEATNSARAVVGCRFRARCWKAAELCAEEDPALTDRPRIGHQAACHFPEEGAGP